MLRNLYFTEWWLLYTFFSFGMKLEGNSIIILRKGGFLQINFGHFNLI
jgi:hypothetical protein